MNNGPQLLYHKSLSLRSGETVKILLGEAVPVSRASVRIDLESANPKTISVTPVSSADGHRHDVKHVRVDRIRCEIKLGKSDTIGTFDEVEISVPEDTNLHLGIYIKP